MIAPELIEKVLAGVDIIEIVGRHVDLKKKGANHVGRCPFHEENTPSFTVSKNKQFFHCFGSCGKHGDAIAFLMEYCGIPFMDALKELARDAGVEIPEADESKFPQTAGLHDLMRAAAKHYAGALPESGRAAAYLAGRGVSAEMIDRFSIGFAAGGASLKSVFNNYQDEQLVEAGLVVKSDDGLKRFDRFRDRIIFPIMNARGGVIAFGGRVLDKSEPKYLNSPETPLFRKGDELYGLQQAKSAIEKEKIVFVVEGYLDVVLLAQYGIENVVATLGTATTPVHIQKLLRVADRIVFCFDGDKAGLNAAWKAMINALPRLSDGKEISFMFLPAGHDPDTYVREAGRDAFIKAAAAAKPLVDFFMNGVMNGLEDVASGHIKMIDRAKPLLASIDKTRAPATLMVLKAALSRRAGVSVSDVSDAVSAAKVVPTGKKSGKEDSAAVFLTRRVLQCILWDPGLTKLVPEGFCGAGPDAAMLLDALAATRGAEVGINRNVLSRILQDAHGADRVSSIEVDMLLWDESFDAEAELEGMLKKRR